MLKFRKMHYVCLIQNRHCQFRVWYSQKLEHIGSEVLPHTFGSLGETSCNTQCNNIVQTLPDSIQLHTHTCTYVHYTYCRQMYTNTYISMLEYKHFFGMVKNTARWREFLLSPAYLWSVPPHCKESAAFFLFIPMWGFEWRHRGFNYNRGADTERPVWLSLGRKRSRTPNCGVAQKEVTATPLSHHCSSVAMAIPIATQQHRPVRSSKDIPEQVPAWGGKH